ncbi:disintegrin and metalloproteinase domain-containing protein 12-like [Toxorhynchites rutilus septentrionalis]|uniref:disintegrin and metalloproteinase domain-containing protein 12-like n=1 Tax=Toxorhynchites rutilus septentrionalis TaxID=329112 RepID=UPI0024798255|nr:disintegrin and metalloproteinase domain-containing protein 12-like [Toxorhynchites rutilus septentrionalis]
MISTSAFILLTSVITLVVCGQSNSSQPQNKTGSVPRAESDNEEKFEQYARIFPLLHHKGSSQDEEKNRLGRLSISYVLDGVNVTLDLSLNEEMIPEEHFVSVQDNGQDRPRKLAMHEVELCHYHGIIRGQPSSYVALSACDDGISGAVYDHEVTYLLESEQTSSGWEHFVYKQRHQARAERTKRALESPQAAAPPSQSFQVAYRSNRASNYVELVLVIDRSLYRTTANVQRIHRYCLDLVNAMNAIYRPLNIYIALVGVVIWSDQDPIEISKDSKKTLENFLHYRRSTLLKMIPHDNAHLLTAVHFADSIVGKAEMGSMCTFAGSGGVEVVDTNFVPLQASTIAHEMGHNFNIDHDGPECSCPSGSCVMASKTVRSQAAPHRWSSCSVEHLETALKHGLGSCLKNKPVKMFVRSTCGNGLVEPGEECDCGLPHVCDTKCCDPSTCQLTVNATCAAGECCDLEDCKLKSAGVSCRMAVGECDLPEYCDGQTAVCPKDVYLRDTEPCASGRAFCYGGQCRTRDSQCKVLWGPTAKSIDDYCYQTNRNGSIFGNCGNDLLTGEYTKCGQEDMLCGLLHCSHKNEKLDFGMQAYSKLTTTKFSHYGPRGTVRETICNTAIVDLGLEVANPGLVPDGAKCGSGKMCWNQRCVSLTHLQENDVGEDCAEGCRGHGVCNSEGNCHCDEGYGGQFCEQSGQGGSIDSGPIVDPNSTERTTIALYISFTVLLFIGIGGVLYFYRYVLTEYLRNLLVKFRMRKYGHIVPPASPTMIAPAKPPRLDISAPTLISTMTTNNMYTATKVDPPPLTRSAPAPPTLEPAQHFIKVNINNHGKVTIENKVVNSPFLLSSPLLDTHEAIHEIKIKGVPAILSQRTISVDSNDPLLDENPKPVVETPPILASPDLDLGTLLSQVKLKKVQDFQNQRSKSDEKPSRRLPQLPRQKTIGEFQNVIAEVHPKRSPATEEPPPNPFGEVTLKKVKPRTPHLSRENLDEIVEESDRSVGLVKPVQKPDLNRPKPSLPQKPVQHQPIDNHIGGEHQSAPPTSAIKPKPARRLPQVPPLKANGNRPPLARRPAVSEDAEPSSASGSSVAALKAKLNLAQIAGGIKR